VTVPLRVAIPAFLVPCLWASGCHSGPSGSSKDQSTPVAFTHVTVIPMDSDRVLRDQTVITQGDTIAALGPTDRVQVPPNAQIVEGQGAFLMPGLTDMHVHVQVPEELLSDFVWGVTTVAFYSGDARSLRWRSAVAHGALLGPTIYTTAPIVDGVPPVSESDAEIANGDEARIVVDSEKQRGYDFIKVHNNIAPNEYHALLAEAKAQGIIVVGHIPRAVGAEETLRAGQVGIAHAEEYYFTYFGVRPDTAKIPAIVTQTKAAHAWVVAMLSSTPDILGLIANIDSEMRFPEARYLPPAVFEDYRPANNGYLHRPNLAAFVARNRIMGAFLPVFVKALSDSGANLLVGTDATSLNFPGWAAHVEIRDLVEAGLTPYQALRVATRNAGAFVAEHIRSTDRFGTIAPGMRADLILLTANPLTDMRNIDSLSGVMARGRWRTIRALRRLRDDATASYDSVKVLVVRFDSLVAADRIREATAVFDRAVQTQPAEPPFNEGVLFDYGKALLPHDPAGAASLMRSALRLYPDAFELHNALGRALVATHDTTQARVEFATALDLEPGNDASIRMLDSLRKQTRSREVTR
jgi:imidazolonepropionase-like amidohydrolase